jgi:hypothetical protein
MEERHALLEAVMIAPRAWLAPIGNGLPAYPFLCPIMRPFRLPPLTKILVLPLPLPPGLSNPANPPNTRARPAQAASCCISPALSRLPQQHLSGRGRGRRRRRRRYAAAVLTSSFVLWTLFNRHTQHLFNPPNLLESTSTSLVILDSRSTLSRSHTRYREQENSRLCDSTNPPRFKSSLTANFWINPGTVADLTQTSRNLHHDILTPLRDHRDSNQRLVAITVVL